MANFDNYGLDKDFEIKGFFSDDKSKVLTTEARSGILNYKQNQIVLELFDELPRNNDVSYGLFKEVDRIYGWDSSANFLILDIFGNPFGTSTVPGFPLVKYSVKDFKIFEVRDGGLSYIESLPSTFDMLETLEFGSMTFSFDNIDKWVGKPLLNFTRGENQLTVTTATSDYKSTKVKLYSQSVLVEDVGSTSYSFKDTEFETSYAIQLTHLKNERVPFDIFYDVAIKFKELIEVLSKTPLSFTSINLICENQIQNDCLKIIKGKFFVRQQREKMVWSKAEISLAKLNDSFESILNNWFDKSEQLDFIVRQYTKNLHGNPYLEDSLVDAIRNLEVFSKNFRNDFIKKNKKGKIYLRDLLNELFDSLPKGDYDKIFGNQEKANLVKKLVDTRNYFTHGKRKKNDWSITDFNEMYDMRESLQKVLNYYIYKEIGLNKDGGNE